MCGILGIVHQHSDFSPRLTKSDVMRLHHRGPDGYGIFDDAHVSLGHARLSILDLSERGTQPMSSSDWRYTVTYNGELYNFIEIRNDLRAAGHTFMSESDTEVLLAAYIEWGEGCLEHFRGMFAFAIWDRVEGKLFMARDRCGEKPFFYWMNEETFIFASELKALLPLLPIRPELDASVVDMYLHYQYVPEPFTLLEGVHKLPAAHHMTLSLTIWKVRPVSYWNIEQIQERKGDPVSLIREELDRTVQLTLRSDVPVGVALSGGIDSGAIAALAARHYPAPMHAFSVGYPGRPPYDEREEARGLAKKLGMIFHEVEIPVDSFVDFFPRLVEIMDEPIADPAAFGHFAVPRAAADLGIKVLLTGIGGDEVFWGYEWVRNAVTSNQQAMQTGMLTHIREACLKQVFSDSLRKRLAASGRLPEALRRLFVTTQAARGKTPYDQLLFLGNIPDFSDAFALKRLCYGEAMHVIDDGSPFIPTQGLPEHVEDVPAAILRLLFKTWLVSNCLNLGDRVSMAVGVESRLPLLDKNLIELVMGLRRAKPDHTLPHKAWLRQALKGILPDEVLDRPKRGFQPPVHAWLGGVIACYGEHLRGGQLVRSGILKAGVVESLLQDWPTKGWAHLFFVYKLVLLECWCERVGYIQNSIKK